MAKGTRGESCQGPSPVTTPRLSRTKALGEVTSFQRWPQQPNAPNACKPTHNNARSPLQRAANYGPRSGDGDGAWPSRLTAGTHTGSVSLRVTLSPEASGLPTPPACSAADPSPPPRRCSAWGRTPDQRKEGHSFIRQRKVHLKCKPAHLAPSNSIAKVGSLK